MWCNSDKTLRNGINWAANIPYPVHDEKLRRIKMDKFDFENGYITFPKTEERDRSFNKMIELENDTFIRIFNFNNFNNYKNKFQEQYYEEILNRIEIGIREDVRHYYQN